MPLDPGSRRGGEAYGKLFTGLPTVCQHASITVERSLDVWNVREVITLIM